MIGIDIIEIERVLDIANDIKMLQRIFSAIEIEYIKSFVNKNERIAGLFCAKEAVMKALKCPKGISFLDINILHNADKSPYVVLNNIAKKVFDDCNYKNIEISISHSKTVATAICLIN